MKSYEGRELTHVAVTSAQNQANLEENEVTLKDGWVGIWRANRKY